MKILNGLIIFIVIMAALGTWIYVNGSSSEAETAIAETVVPSGLTELTETIKITQPTTAPTESTSAPTVPITEPTEPPKTEKEIFEMEWGRSAQYIAKTVWGEARGCNELEQRKVIWCILNRVDSADFHDNIIGVIMAPNQFHGFHYDNPIQEEHYQLALEIISLWLQEKQGVVIKRDLEKKYLFFSANSSGTGHNFRTNW